MATIIEGIIGTSLIVINLYRFSLCNTFVFMCQICIILCAGMENQWKFGPTVNDEYIYYIWLDSRKIGKIHKNYSYTLAINQL